MLAAIISDTHLPRGRRALPERAVERLRAADMILHAGDLTAISVLWQLREYGEVAAVHGNADEDAVKAALPERLELTLEGLRVAVIHDGGSRIGRLQRLRSAFPAAAAVIFGHSHIPLHEISDSGGFQIFNPGSPTDKRRAVHHTMGILHSNAERLEFELVELD
jgi:putative phosphoesterase